MVYDRSFIIFSATIILSIILHTTVFVILHKIDAPDLKKEEKPIIISLNIKDSSKKQGASSPKRKIPKKSNLKTPSKTKLHKEKVRKKSNVKKHTNKKPIEKKNKVKKQRREKNLKRIIKKKTEEKIIPEKKHIELPQKEDKQIIEEVIKEDKEQEKTVQIGENKNKIEEKPEIPVPIPSEEKREEKIEENPEQLNLTHLKGKDQIYQMGNEEEKAKEIDTISDEEIRKYLFYVRDVLQENLAYPLAAKRLEIEGTVIVRFIIEKNGYVKKESIKIVKSSGSNILDKQAIITVENSIPFKPPPKERIVVEIPVVFEIIRYNL